MGALYLGRLGRSTRGGCDRKKNWGSACAPNGFKNLTRAMKILNICLVLKLDNGKVVSIANEQTESQGRVNLSVLVFGDSYFAILKPKF